MASLIITRLIKAGIIPAIYDQVFTAPAYSILPTDFDTTLVIKNTIAQPVVITVIPGTRGGQKIKFVDELGNAGTYGISLLGSGCTIDLNPTNSGIDGDFGYTEIKWDNVSNWMVQ